MNIIYDLIYCEWLEEKTTYNINELKEEINNLFIPFNHHKLNQTNDFSSGDFSSGSIYGYNNFRLNYGNGSYSCRSGNGHGHGNFYGDNLGNGYGYGGYGDCGDGDH